MLGQECNNEMRIKRLTKKHEKQISFQSIFDFPAIELKFAIETASSSIKFLVDCFKLTTVILWMAKRLIEVYIVEDYFQLLPVLDHFIFLFNVLIRPAI